MKTSSPRVSNFGPEVKFWLAEDDGVEAHRPSHCAACGASAHRRDGRIRLHGHGARIRTVWGPPSSDGAAGLWEVQVRRYRCTSCEAVRTAERPGLGMRLRYSLCAIALALMAWAVWGWTAAQVRDKVSPFRIVARGEVGRWRSLGRWSERAEVLFRVPEAAGAPPRRERATRVAALVRARGPTDESDGLRVFVGARVR